MAQPQPLIPDSEPTARTLRVMLVDDSLVVRSILERIVDQRAGLKICASVASATRAQPGSSFPAIRVSGASMKHTSSISSASSA